MYCVRCKLSRPKMPRLLSTQPRPACQVQDVPRSHLPPLSPTSEPPRSMATGSGLDPPPHVDVTVSPPAVVLTRRMVEGDEEAYRIFYDAYYERLRRYLLVVASGNEDAVRD